MQDLLVVGHRGMSHSTAGARADFLPVHADVQGFVLVAKAGRHCGGLHHASVDGIVRHELLDGSFGAANGEIVELNHGNHRPYYCTHSFVLHPKHQPV